MEKFAKFYVWYIDNVPIYFVGVALLLGLIIFFDGIYHGEFELKDTISIFVNLFLLPIFLGFCISIIIPLSMPFLIVYSLIYLIIYLRKKYGTRIN